MHLYLGEADRRPRKRKRTGDKLFVSGSVLYHCFPSERPIHPRERSVFANLPSFDKREDHKNTLPQWGATIHRTPYRDVCLFLRRISPAVFVPLSFPPCVLVRSISLYRRIIISLDINHRPTGIVPDVSRRKNRVRDAYLYIQRRGGNGEGSEMERARAHTHPPPRQ